MNLTCFIIDDEPLAIEVIESHLSKIDGIEIEATFQNAVKAFQALRNTKVDILFLDIQMPKLTGIEFLRTLKNPPKVIFTTAYREYALEGFELDVIDYLLKPISFDRFLKAVDKIFDSLSPRSHLPAPNEIKDEQCHIFVISDKRNVKVCLNDIVYIESKRDYILIKTKDKEVETYQTISYMEEHLPDNNFLRVHRSFIINMSLIDSWSNNEVELLDSKIPIGRTFKREALKRLGETSQLI
ncbi:MAG: LytTR family DNA-binding domain-containing protein [Balneolaceae bacterium]